MKLNSIDDLVYQCSDKKSRIFIKEAVNAYKAGAYRSTITYTWIAIFFNINLGHTFSFYSV